MKAMEYCAKSGHESRAETKCRYGLQMAILCAEKRLSCRTIRGSFTA